MGEQARLAAEQAAKDQSSPQRSLIPDASAGMERGAGQFSIEAARSDNSAAAGAVNVSQTAKKPAYMALQR
jgi:hypothetical protein